MKPLSDRLIRAVDERFDPPVREGRHVQRHRENTPLHRVSSGKILLPGEPSQPCGEHPQLTSLPVFSRFLHAKTDSLHRYTPKEIYVLDQN